MSVEKREQPAKTPTDDGVAFLDDKGAANLADGETNSLDNHIGHELQVTEDDLLEAKALAETMTLEGVTKLMRQVLKIHARDPNFPHEVILRIDEFLQNEDVFENPEKHAALIYEMKLEAALITNNSPYAEVRAVVDNKDDPKMPCSTIRAWVLGCLFSVILAFVNQLFNIRQPLIYIESNVAQLLAFPLGKAWEKFMPAYEFTLLGTTFQLNPGRFNKKEHILIAIMANTAKSFPYTQYMIWSQVLPHMFNQQYARDFGYQLLISLSTNFIGYGLAGLTRRFIVYPPYCIWPASLVTIALNSALHNETNAPVPGPFGRLLKMSRFRFFLITFGAMFVYFWLPNYLFTSLSFFSWMTWIAPDNINLSILTGMNGGLGMLNPWPTFDWNIMFFDLLDPLMVPFYSTINRTVGMWCFGLVILGLVYSNTWNMAYLPVNSNRVFDHFGGLYNVSMIIDDRGWFDHDKYVSYSAAYLAAGQSILYCAYYCIYSAAIVHVLIFHRFELATGFKNIWGAIRRKKRDANTDEINDEDQHQDIHNHLMSRYKEVSEWWYFATLLVAAGFGFAGIGAWPTYTTLGVVPFGVGLSLIFVIPIGIIKAMTGIEITLNVLSEFIGGFWADGNALAMNYFKTFGYVTCASAVHFANDLKIAHYLKVPPRVTFASQMIATLISTFVCVGVLRFQIEIENVCLPNAPMRFTCPGINSYFTSSVLWGTIGPVKVFGHKGQYGALLIGFIVGLVAPIIYYFLTRWFPRNRYLRQVHPVALFFGGVNWAPYSFSYAWPAVPIAWLSWVWLRKRYLAMWSKYNFVLSASFSAGIAISGLVMLFSVQWAGIEINWWGNTQLLKGCENSAATCSLQKLGEGERFFPWWSSSSNPTP